jgi:rare lipoprotein A
MYRATMRPYTVNGRKYCPEVVSVGDTFNGTASWYGDNFHGRLTSNGEYYNMHDLTAAHKTLPINTKVRVTNLRNNLSTVVRINDRGPFVDDRIIDLSKEAASQIDMIRKGTAPVKLEVLEFDESAVKYAHNKPKKAIKKTQVATNSVWKRYDPTEFTTTEEKPKKEPKIVTGGEYSIQVASLTKKEGANKIKEKCYNTKGYNPYIKEKVVNNQTIYRVLLNGFKSIKEAKDYISKNNYNGAFIIRN